VLVNKHRCLANIVLIKVTPMKKLFLSAVLALAFMFTPALAQAPAPAAPVEYNVFLCSGTMHVYHTDFNKNKDGKETFSIDYDSASPGELVKLPDPVVFDVIRSEKGPEGAIYRITTMEKEGAEDADITLVLFTYKDRIIGLFKDGDSFSGVIYGTQGPVSQVFEDVDSKVKFCGGLHSIDKEAVPNILIEWLIQKDEPAAQGAEH
jgi:hypothetical protein